MFWIMMYMLLFNGSVMPELAFTPPERTVIESVSDEQRLPAILSIHREMVSQEEELLAFMKQEYGKLVTTSGDPATKEDSFRAVFENMDRKRNAIQSALIQNRFRLKSQMSREEWKTVFKKK